MFGVPAAVRLYGHVQRREEGIAEAIEKERSPTATWNKQVKALI